jgi:hypothetical protein
MPAGSFAMQGRGSQETLLKNLVAVLVVVILCFRVLSMGDTNAVDFGQTIHENLLRQAGALVEEDTLRYGLPMPEGDLLQGVYLNDFLVLAKVARADVHIPGVDTARLRKAFAYVAAGFEVADDKMYHHEVNFKAWGAEVLGGLGKVGAPFTTRRELWRVARAVAVFSYIGKTVVRQVLGSVASCFVFRR